MSQSQKNEAYVRELEIDVLLQEPDNKKHSYRVQNAYLYAEENWIEIWQMVDMKPIAMPYRPEWDFPMFDVVFIDKIETEGEAPVKKLHIHVKTPKVWRFSNDQSEWSMTYSVEGTEVKLWDLLMVIQKQIKTYGNDYGITVKQIGELATSIKSEKG